MKRTFACILLSLALYAYGQIQIIHVDKEARPNYKFEQALLDSILGMLSQNGTDASGIVDVFFDIETDGEIVDVRIVKGISEAIDDEIIKKCIYKMPPWIPATYRRRKIRSTVHVIMFVHYL
ncbi:MAG: energy transducer TonB [Bacteroidales bacterium]|nr:energy transducer TonB [Bacteroidales bacterium]